MEIKSLRDLRDFLNTLNDTQLSQRALVAGEEDFTPIDSAVITEEDWVAPGDGEDGAFPVSQYEPEDYDGEPVDSDFNKIIPKGYVYLYEDF
ncbi:hypothetical protein [Pedobacter cryoconitis]|uniref:Uncharacterized protein n=1 Tax=Pedobacter cryoconitis TaxID=188932 RepID=A0A327SMY3_9SPHI|nr:hypothetical protein [Pedobacter cryoconitis]RAJ28893.1 hypothetical protein LY11_03167 [Pedobacter cryoconitis]